MFKKVATFLNVLFPPNTTGTGHSPKSAQVSVFRLGNRRTKVGYTAPQMDALTRAILFADSDEDIAEMQQRKPNKRRRGRAREWKQEQERERQRERNDQRERDDQRGADLAQEQEDLRCAQVNKTCKATLKDSVIWPPIYKRI